MGRLSGFKYRDITRKLQALGFEFDRQASGSHEIWHHPASGRRALLARHTVDSKEGTLRGILKRAGIDVEEFLKA